MKTLLAFILAFSTFGLVADDDGHSLGKGQLEELVATKGSPIIYNKQVGEYQLVWTNYERVSVQGSTVDATVVHTIPLKFDPFTGRELGSRRDELFSEPSQGESREVLGKLRGCKSIEDVIKQFGKPDRVWPKDELRRCAQYDFEKCFRTLRLVVVVGEDGALQTSVAGKQIKEGVNE